ncbi:Asp-tRNA(Asn)/Glu-tRNA(Gln) amidotransferase subunit GatC [Aeromicrobium piscarium]|uniref:Aspartyl/glutamyl-tRNA(Asn/Gln) amidotransferase subunit C n=1 Tax=Aeromicrobium piscarium TaxID=2590901 RepID=A0A554SGP4_9ACTN|nr:Asp-tRNA(Asn)/Glu-tRNA(Gln) amidotransferase subunit GatC [Aeromicrobium piscarium]TSD65514.1 Asp-tRNA(Asn)/Glu-tRNA(Gln) amidotransferase subunit GatC [Aeromicrobium piscarium]
MSSSAISRDDVAHLASLARIDLSDDELDRLGAELPAILEHVKVVQQVAGDDVPAMSHPIPVTNVLRADEVCAGLTPEQALSGAPDADEQRFSVPQILGEE